MNDKKISFIICSNSEMYLAECMEYIARLSVPVGYEIEVLGITDAICMTGGYNEGRLASDAKYKIYMHQDVFIVYKYFLHSLLEIFHSDAAIGMIGMVGAPKMQKDGVMWNDYRRGNLHGCFTDKQKQEEYFYHLEDGLHQVQAIDGLLMATSVDLPWREDVFDGWDFYDVSQSFEMQRHGYQVVVPEQQNAWCVHDDGILNMRSYNKYRQICLQEYAEFFDRE